MVNKLQSTLHTFTKHEALCLRAAFDTSRSYHMQLGNPPGAASSPAAGPWAERLV